MSPLPGLAAAAGDPVMATFMLANFRRVNLPRRRLQPTRGCSMSGIRHVIPVSAPHRWPARIDPVV